MEQALPQSAPQPNRFSNAIRWILRAGIWLLLFAWLFSYFGAYFYVAELFSNFRLQFLVLIFVALLLSRIAHARRLLTICLLIALAWSCQETFRIYLPADQPPAGESVVRLMSFNILATNDAYEPVISEIKRHDPDVLVVIEYAGIWHDILNALNESYPYQHRDPRWHGYGIAVFSKIPFESAQSVPLTQTAIDNPAANVTLKIDNRRVHLTAAHVMSPVTYYRQQLRNEQFHEIAEIVNSNSGSSSDSSILVGDMNCTTASSYLAGPDTRDEAPR